MDMYVSLVLVRTEKVQGEDLNSSTTRNSVASKPFKVQIIYNMSRILELNDQILIYSVGQHLDPNTTFTHTLAIQLSGEGP
jgi:hypothetical protein